MSTGKFIVIEGGDAAGKQTQTKLLVERAKQYGFRTAQVAFPRYDTPIGKEIKRYLNGEYGNLNEVDVRFASLMYMMDRHDAQPWIQRTLNRTDLLIADRYSTANMSHQAEKATGKKMKELMQWLYDFEQI